MAVTVLEHPQLADLSHKRDRDVLWLRASSIHVDPLYQRSLDMKRVGELAKNWNDKFAGTWVVNMREDGVVACIDGGHRLRAVQVARDEDVDIPCAAFYGLTQQEEARVFAAINGRLRRNPTPMENFKARLAANEKKAHAILVAIRQADCDVNWGGHSGSHMHESRIKAISAVERLFDMAGQDGVTDALSELRRIWPNNSRAFSAALILGMHSFLVAFRDVVDRKTLREKLGQMKPEQVESKALVSRDFMPRSTSPGYIAQTMRSIYNSGKRSKLLPEWTVAGARGPRKDKADNKRMQHEWL